MVIIRVCGNRKERRKIFSKIEQAKDNQKRPMLCMDARLEWLIFIFDVDVDDDEEKERIKKRQQTMMMVYGNVHHHHP